jgi:seryl-tRNA synthetase
MIDIKRIKEDPAAVKAGFRAKEVDCDEAGRPHSGARRGTARADFVHRDQKGRSEQGFEGDSPAQEGRQDVAPICAAWAELKASIAENDSRLAQVEAEYRTLMLSLPNLPDPDLKPGGKENNEPLRYFGEPHQFDFPPKHHVDLCTDLGLIDYERGAKLAGTGFWIYKRLGRAPGVGAAELFHGRASRGRLRDGDSAATCWNTCGETAGQFPKFADEVYKIENPTDDRMHFMLPTAETALASLHRDEILTEAELPHKLLRLHALLPPRGRLPPRRRARHGARPPVQQGRDVPVLSARRSPTKPLRSWSARPRRWSRGLGFHFRTVKLAAGDCSASMARTYDIEIQIPSMNGYKEVSSVSNARDYQARRGNIRFRREATGKHRVVHTLNGSGLATSPHHPRHGRAEPARRRLGRRAGGAAQISRRPGAD